jgi:hypothetical protein
METNPGLVAYLIAIAIILRAACALFRHGLRRPCTPAALLRDGRVEAR